MKLSEALRLGEFAVEPVHNDWVKVDATGKACGACAVGRASIAAGYMPTSASNVNTIFGTFRYRDDLPEIAKFWNRQWPWTKDYEMPERFENEYGCDNDVLAAVSDLYEEFHMPISMIADWVATIEPKDAEHDKREENLRTEKDLQHPDLCQS